MLQKRRFMLSTSESEINMNRFVLFVVLGVLFFGVLLSACKKFEQSMPKNAASGEEAAATAQSKVALKFKTVSYVDRQGIGIEAFRMLIPTDWSFEGGIRWLLENPGMPAVASFRIRSETGKDELEVFPNQSFFWTTNQMTLQLFPVGSRYFGAEVRPPVGAIAALRDIVIKRFRKGYSELHVVSERQLPDLARSLGAGQSQPGVTAGAEGASVRIEYKLGQSLKEEEIYAVVESFSFPIQSMFGMQTNTMWTVDYVFSFKSDKGHLDDQTKLFQTIISSFRLNPQWFNKYNQVVEYLIQRQIQQIRSVGELSRIISQTHNEISDMMMETYNNRQQVYDRLSENFSQHIRGVDEYYNPVEQKPVELPSGYHQAWTNSLGEYILSDQEDFNPNIGSNQTWQKMEKKLKDR
jgi:hypothetical protein